jgi:hypothetical protein
MQWVKMSVDKSDKLPFTVQIRGTQDKLVGPNDSRDVSVAHNSLELIVDGVGHRDLALLIPQRQGRCRAEAGTEDRRRAQSGAAKDG